MEATMVCTDYLAMDSRCAKGIPVAPGFRNFFCETQPEQCPLTIWEKSLPETSTISRPKSLINIWRRTWSVHIWSKESYVHARYWITSIFQVFLNFRSTAGQWATESAPSCSGRMLNRMRIIILVMLFPLPEVPSRGISIPEAIPSLPILTTDRKQRNSFLSFFNRNVKLDSFRCNNQVLS